MTRQFEAPSFRISTPSKPPRWTQPSSIASSWGNKGTSTSIHARGTAGPNGYTAIRIQTLFYQEKPDRLLASSSTTRIMATETAARKFFTSPFYAVVGASSNPAKFGHKGPCLLIALTEQLVSGLNIPGVRSPCLVPTPRHGCHAREPRIVSSNCWW